MTIVYILTAILIFGVLIAVHELGHFLAAKSCNVQVNEFSIGMGLPCGTGRRARQSIPSARSPSAVIVPWRGRRKRLTIPGH